MPVMTDRQRVRWTVNNDACFLPPYSFFLFYGIKIAVKNGIAAASIGGKEPGPCVITVACLIS